MATNEIVDAKKAPSNENQPIATTLSVKLVKNSKKQMHIMQFNEAQQVKFADWRQARLNRENNSLAYQIQDEPKFGGGSVFGRAAREEERHRRFARSYKPENQPWILTTNSTDGGKGASDKTFKGIREGGVGENSTYYVFVTNSDGKSVSAYPVQDWYKFRSIQRYKTLSVEEAEEEYLRRDKRLNYFSLMTQRRLRSEDENEEAKNQAIAVKKSVQDLEISEVDDWISSDQDDDDDDSDADNKQPDNDKDKKKKKKANLKKKNASDNEAFEESDDGDEEGREWEYITDSSASEPELEQQKEEGTKSVAEETDLKNLFGSDSESRDDENDESENKDEDKNKKLKEKRGKMKSARGADKSVHLQGADKENKSPGDNLLSVTEDKIVGKDEAKFQKRTKSVSSDEVQAKRYKYESTSALSNSSYIAGASESGINVEVVSRYLKRKPMTLVELLKKFKTKKSSLSKEEVGRILTLTLQKIKLNKKKMNGVTYYLL